MVLLATDLDAANIETLLSGMAQQYRGRYSHLVEGKSGIMGERDQEFGIGFGYYWGVVKRQRWVIALGVILGIGAAITGYSFTEPSYAATTQVQISPLGEDPVALSQNPANLIDHSSEMALVTSDVVMAASVEELGSGSAGALRKKVNPNMDRGSTLITITFEDTNPQLAIEGSAVVARNYLNQREQLIIATVENRLKVLDAELAALTDSPDAQAQRTTLYGQRLEIMAVDTNAGNILNEANTQSLVRKPSLKIWGASGLVLGLLAGLIIAIWRDNRSPEFRDCNDISKIAQAPIVGTFGTIESTLPLPDDAMLHMGAMRERVLARSEEGKIIVLGAGELTADPHEVADSYQVKLPVEFSIAFAVSLSHVAEGVTLVIAGCYARELIRITRHLSLYQDPKNPTLLRTHHAPNLAVVTFTYEENSRTTTVMTSEVVKGLNADASYTVLALGSAADASSRITATRHCDHAVVAVDPRRTTRPDLAHTTQIISDLHTSCAGVITVESSS